MHGQKNIKLSSKQFMNLRQRDVRNQDCLLQAGILIFQTRSFYFRYHKPDKTREKSELKTKGRGTHCQIRTAVSLTGLHSCSTRRVKDLSTQLRFIEIHAECLRAGTCLIDKPSPSA